MCFAIVALIFWSAKLELSAIDIYLARVRAFLTFVVPVAFPTTFPTQSLLDKGDLRVLAGALGFAIFLLLVSRAFFKFARRFYGSASS